ncbi:MAG: hypothetical protein IMY72_03125 [Bacteroidetes bacterium]|nr:hypothetical protein [Bacteroidota bacterium]
MKNYKVFVIILAMMFSCSKNEDMNFAAVAVDSYFDFLVVNENDENLFDVATENNWDVNEIKLFYVKNGEPELHYTSRLGSPAPYGYLLTEHRNLDNILRVFMNYEPDLDTSITYIKWNELRTDTLKATYNNTNGYQKKEVWFNGEKVWDDITEYYCQKLVIK